MTPTPLTEGIRFLIDALRGDPNATVERLSKMDLGHVGPDPTLTDQCECSHCDRKRQGLPPVGDGGAGQVHIQVHIPVNRPILTDEELAEWSSMWDHAPKTVAASHIDIGRLIAALRASRGEAERLYSSAQRFAVEISILQAALRASREEVEALRGEAAQLESGRRWLLAEVERLRAEVAELQVDPAAEYDAASDLRQHS